MAVDRTLFGRLKRLFSTGAIIRNIGGNQLKVMDIDRIQSLGNIQTNTLVDRFTRIHRSSTSFMFNPIVDYPTLRVQLYNDYEAMDMESIIASSLDIIADECTLKNEGGEVLQITSSDERVQKILYNLFYDVLNIEFNLWPWIRNMCKYGDFYLHLQIAEEFGIFNVEPLMAYELIRKEGKDATNPTEVYFEIDQNATARTYRSMGKTADRLENYEIAHFRLLSDVNWLPYGRAFIEPARKVYKQYVLMKDAMLLHRIMRAPEKRVFYVDVGSIPPNEVEAYMQKFIDKMKKTPYIDHQTGDYNLKFNIQNALEDFYIPIRGQSQSTKIDTTKGLDYNAIEDVNFLRDEMLAALKVPKAFFGFEKDLTGKATLAAEDIRFARTIERIQRIVCSELTKIALVHLYVQGFEKEQLTNFELSLTPPSVIYQQEMVALGKEKIGLAQDMLDSGLFSSDYIYERIYQMSEDQYDDVRDLIIEDKKRLFRLGQIENEGNDPAKTGQSYGTPHDLAALYGRGRMNNGDIPSGYNENIVDVPDAGRPEEKVSNYGTQQNSLGKDPIGKKEISAPPELDKKINPSFKGGSPLALEVNMNYLRNKSMLDSIPKKKIVLYENSGENSEESSLLDEKNIIND
jgi:hypothetical protein